MASTPTMFTTTLLLLELLLAAKGAPHLSGYENKNLLPSCVGKNVTAEGCQDAVPKIDGAVPEKAQN